jgi:hypothetical protein
MQTNRSVLTSAMVFFVQSLQVALFSLVIMGDGLSFMLSNVQRLQEFWGRLVDCLTFLLF